MEILVLFFIGVIQGVTEFLPVSSSGHIVLFSKIFGIEESLFLSVILHVATLLSILVVFWKDVWKIIRNPFSEISIKIFVATIPTCVIALVLMPFIKTSFGGNFLPFCFIISAILLLFAEDKSKVGQNKKINFQNAFLIGVVQGFAIFPGISRSGTTISAGLIQGNEKSQTAKFSFLMSIPIILASLVLEIFDCINAQVAIENPVGICLAFISAFIVGIFSIKIVLKMTQKANLKWFSIYLIIVGFACFFVM